jgi:hypothetical protein
MPKERMGRISYLDDYLRLYIWVVEGGIKLWDRSTISSTKS